MSIWIEDISLESIQTRSQQTMADHLGIEFIEIGDDTLKATMPVDQRTRQPLGLLNGGASCALAETLGSTAANYCVDQSQQYCVGLSINASHVRSVRQGLVTGIAKPLHLGRSTQLWDIKIYDEADKLVCVTRLTMTVMSRSK